MSKSSFRLSIRGLRELMNSQEMVQTLLEAGEAVRAQAGEGFIVDTYRAKNITVVDVEADTRKAYSACLHENVLLKALGRSGLPMK